MNKQQKYNGFWQKSKYAQKNIIFNKKLIDWHEQTLKQLVETYACGVKTKSTAELLHAEIPFLKSKILNVQQHIAELNKQLNAEKEKRSNLEQKLQKFNGSFSERFAVIDSGTVDSDKSQEWLEDDLKQINLRVEQIRLHIVQYENEIIKIKVQLDYVNSTVNQHVKEYSVNLSEMRTWLQACGEVNKLAENDQVLAKVIDAHLQNASNYTHQLNDRLSGKTVEFLKQCKVDPKLCKPIQGNMYQATFIVSNCRHTNHQAEMVLLIAENEHVKAYCNLAINTSVQALEVIQKGTPHEAICAVDLRLPDVITLQH